MKIIDNLSRTLKNRNIIKAGIKFYPWDYAFILYLERESFKRMLNYFSNDSILEVRERQYLASRIRLIIRLLDFLTDHYYEGKLNFRNSNRFSKYNLAGDKIWNLYCKAREQYFRLFWD
jgi:hypothetical protein